jgi:hypothetical protein
MVAATQQDGVSGKPPAVRLALAAAVAGNLPALTLAASFAVVWLAPRRLGDAAVVSAVTTMLLEFLHLCATIVILQTVLQPGLPRATQLRRLALGCGWGGAVVLGLCWGLGTPWAALAAFAMLVATTVTGILRRGELGPAETAFQRRSVGVGLALYVALAFVASLVPLPRLGVVGDGHDYGFPAGSGGLWHQEPHRLIAFGCLYFALSALAGMWIAVVQALRPLPLSPEVEP